MTPVLVDTGIWVDHLRHGDPQLAQLLGDGLVLGHPSVAGELALGGVPASTLGLLAALPRAPVATPVELLSLIADRSLAGRGIGLVDVQLLAATLLHGAAHLWSRDRALAATAAHLGCAR